MKIISHRGNINGIIQNRENSPSYIEEAISAGYDVEIDLWINGSKDWYLGHDYGMYKVSESWICDRANHLWIHCKNSHAICSLVEQNTIKFFSHSSDKFSLTSDNKIWYHYTKSFHEIFECDPRKIIIPYLDYNAASYGPLLDFYAICTDHPEVILKRTKK
tara:strand:- start:592 stop:1074 length:483 start_codon:yes stop_codon:yes gene_type:complete